MARSRGSRLIAPIPPCGGDGSRLHEHDVRREPQHLVELMADVDHRKRQLIPQRLQIGQYFLAALPIERGERLVEQQQPRLRQQGAADGDALLLAAGQLMHAARHERLQVEHAEPPARIRSIRARAARRSANFRFPATLKCGNSRAS